MKLAIFGATGKVGREVVAQALAEGHEVTALARNPAKLADWAGRIRVIEGDVYDRDAVGRALAGQEAVVIALGKPLRNREGLREKGTRVIVDEMRRVGPRRLVVLSSAGVGDSFASLPALYRWLLVPLMFRRAFADHAAQEAVVRASGLDWVIVRPVNMDGSPKTGVLRADLPRSLAGRKMKLPRADVAGFLLGQIRAGAFLHKAPVLTG